MGKVGNYITGLSVAAVMAGSPASAEAQENVASANENGKKIEYVQDNLRDELKNDSTVAWETVVSSAQQLKEPSKDSSRDDTAQEMREDGKKFNKTDSIINKIEEAIINNEPKEKIDSLANVYNDAMKQDYDKMMATPQNLSMEECAANAVFECMAQQTTHKKRISQRYGATEEEYEKMQAEGKNNVYGDFLEHLATTGDKKLGKALGVPEDKMTPENITMALAYGPKIPYEMQEKLYNDAKEDGRIEGYKENVRSIGGNNERWSELSMTGEFPENGAHYTLGIEKIRELSDNISQKYGENANALLVKAFTGDKELSEKLGFKDEKPDAQQLVYMLANAEPLSKEDQNKMVTEQDRVVADKVLDHMENKNHKEEYFTLNYKEQKGENSVQSVVDMVKGEQVADNTKNLGNKLKEDLANIHPKTEKVSDNAMAMNVSRMQQKGGR